MTRRSLVLLITLLAAVAGVLYLWRPGGPSVRNGRPAGSNIIALGDSLTAGYGLAPGQDFISLASGELGVPILNAGISGDTTTSALARLDRDVLERDPKVVIIELGANDILKARRSPAEVIANIEEMVERVHAAGAAVMLVGVEGPLGARLGLRAEIAALARRHRTACIPNLVQGIVGRPSLMLDPLHPNAEGHRRMADRLVKALRRQLPEVFRGITPPGGRT